MNTRALMTISSLLMGLTGLVLTFLPGEIILYTGMASGHLPLLLLQVLGALYFAFAMLNWMARANIIGGIYSRPVAIGNFTHFFMAGIALLKSASLFDSVIPWAAGVISLSISVLFGFVLYTHPVKDHPVKNYKGN